MLEKFERNRIDLIFDKIDQRLESIESIINRMIERLERIEHKLKKLTLTIDEEAKLVINHKLKDMGLNIEIDQLILPDIKVDIYGADNKLCIIGEAHNKAFEDTIESLNIKIKKLKESYPEKLRSKIIKVIYALWASEDLIERAKKEKVWILKATKNITEPEIDTIRLF